MTTSKPTIKAQATIPQAIRTALHLQEGDTLANSISGQKVALSRLSKETVEDPFATFDEWNSQVDQRADGKL